MQTLEAANQINWEKGEIDTETDSNPERKELEATKKQEEKKNLREGDKSRAHMLRVNNLEQLVGFILTIMAITLTNINQ